LSRTNTPEPVLQSAANATETLAVAADHLMPGASAFIDNATLGAPDESLKDIPRGDYFVEAYARPYVEYRRADGHVIWGLDQWNGQDGARSPGTLVSPVQRVRLGPASETTIFALTRIIPPAPPPHDTAWIRNVRIRSEVLSRFWGRPIYLGATVLLPKGYADNPQRSYPVIYEPRNHYRRDAPFAFTTTEVAETNAARAHRAGLGFETGYEFYRSWSADGFPQIVVVTLIAPSPFYDFAAAMNSPNDGPFDDAIMKELIPYIETRFRIIRQPHARILLGKSSGGRDALALALHHPEFFGGAWIFYPWAFDYRRYFGLDVYAATNAFRDEASRERVFVRALDGKPVQSWRAWMLGEAVTGGATGVGAEITGTDNALNGPIGENGYPLPLFDIRTGRIDPDVARYWRGHDLLVTAQENWPRIAPLLKGKLHFYAGDSDQWSRNGGVHDLQTFLETANPDAAATFTYGKGKGHEWQPMTNAALVRSISDAIARDAPANATLP
jgi:hypothetical protein